MDYSSRTGRVLAFPLYQAHYPPDLPLFAPLRAGTLQAPQPHPSEDIYASPAYDSPFTGSKLS